MWALISISIIHTLDVDHIIIAVALPPLWSTFHSLARTLNFTYDTLIVVFGLLRFRSWRRRRGFGLDKRFDRLGLFGNFALFNNFVGRLLSSKDNLLSGRFLLYDNRLRRSLTDNDRLWLWLRLRKVLGGFGIFLKVVGVAHSPYVDVSLSLYAPFLVLG